VRNLIENIEICHLHRTLRNFKKCTYNFLVLVPASVDGFVVKREGHSVGRCGHMITDTIHRPL